MALFVGSHLVVPKSIRASTAAALERKILIEQAKTQMELKFISFVYDSTKKEHVGWYYTVEDESKLIEEAYAKTSE